ncbi:hypothetical protein LCGC14_1283400 [marine sediment metagenome]|uniref:Uncharacterized protein n=1 Tax=marine sediment metagenome TaxID=412755 RepID=A0A0F9KWB2_9ZZZZ
MYEKELAQVAILCGKLYKKYPAYVKFDFTLGTHHCGNLLEPYVRYNIYTPEIHHNQYSDFNKFVAFIETILVDGVIDVRIGILEERLENAKESRAYSNEEIKEVERKLKKIKAIP